MQTVSATETTSSALHALLVGIVDYAGLFPPASLPMKTAVSNYAAYRQSHHAWMLSRFITPVARLTEFETDACAFANESKPWQLSALMGTDFTSDAKVIEQFNARHTTFHIDTAEAKVSSVAELETLTTVSSPTLTLYAELPLTADLETLIIAAAANKLRIKIRTGGVTETAFPSAADIARFFYLAAQHDVPFKATAGLHHPIRNRYRLTYDATPPYGMMFGFLNVFCAAVFARAGMTEPDLIQVLNEQNPDAFHLTKEGLAWQGFNVSLAQIRKAREQFATSFGSCSFEEPVDDLKSLNLLA
jgi:hypothetical protein